MRNNWKKLRPGAKAFDNELIQLAGQAGRLLSPAEKAAVVEIEREGELTTFAVPLHPPSPNMTRCSRMGSSSTPNNPNNLIHSQQTLSAQGDVHVSTTDVEWPAQQLVAVKHVCLLLLCMLLLIQWVGNTV